MLDYAKRKQPTSKCIENLESALTKMTKQRLLDKKNTLYTVEHATVSQFIKEAAFPIYVCGAVVQTTILCLMQEITEAYRPLETTYNANELPKQKTTDTAFARNVEGQ